MPEYRRQGIAGKLFELAVEEACKLGVKKIVLHATQDGRRLYGKFGFKQSEDEMTLSVE